MKNPLKNKFFFGMFLCGVIFLFIALNGCARLKQGKEVVGRNPAEPVLVSLDADYMIWCGPDALIYAYAESDATRYVETEIYWYDVHTGRKVMVGKESDDYYDMVPLEAPPREEIDESQETGNYFIFPMACTPDGKWFVYLNKGNIRSDKNGVSSVLDVWRYEVATGRHERIAIARDVAGFDKGILSPDGKRLYLGEKPLEEIEMPEPKWEIVWSDMKNLSGAVWLPDSSAVLTSYWGRLDGNHDIVIEVVTPERKTVIFNPEELDRITLFFSDKRGRVYVYFWDIIEERHVARCNVDMEGKDLSCEDIFVEGGRKLEDHEVFLDGEAVAFTEDGGSCVKALRGGEEKARCITPPIDTLGNYRIPPGQSIKISPDDRWLAFDLVRENEAGEGIGVDLYIIELKRD